MSENQEKLNENKKEYEIKMENDEKRNLYIKTKNVVKDVKVKKYIQDRNEIVKEGVNVFGFISGKSVLQMERLKNIKLKIELLETEKIDSQKAYDTLDILAELFSCASLDLNSVFTKEMQELYDYVKERYADENITDEKIIERANSIASKENNYLPMIHKTGFNGIFANTKSQIDFYRLENLRLQDEILNERGKSQIANGQVIGNKIIPLKVISPEN